MRVDVLDLLSARKGHFPLDSGHRGNLWLDLELLCRTVGFYGLLISELAKRLSRLEIEVVCGPFVEGHLPV